MHRSDFSFPRPHAIIQATVLLSANVGFLAIQSIDNSTDFRSAAQIASYTSALFSLFDYIVVLLLMRRHRMALYDTAERGVRVHPHVTDIAYRC